MAALTRPVPAQQAPPLARLRHDGLVASGPLASRLLQRHERLGVVTTDTGGDGAFHWNFAIQDRNIDFLRAGDRAVLVTDVLIDDHHGSVDHALVRVTLLGADEPPLPPWAPTLQTGGCS